MVIFTSTTNKQNKRDTRFIYLFLHKDPRDPRVTTGFILIIRLEFFMNRAKKLSNSSLELQQVISRSSVTSHGSTHAN